MDCSHVINFIILLKISVLNLGMLEFFMGIGHGIDKK